MKDIIGNLLKNSAYATLPQGTMSLAGLMGLGNQSTFSENLPIAAKMMYEQEQTQRKQQQDSLQRQAYMQYAQANGNQGLAGLIQQGLDPTKALALDKHLNRSMQGRNPYENIFKTDDGLIEIQTDPETGERVAKNLTGERGPLNRKISPAERSKNEEILREHTLTANNADKLMEGIGMLKEAYQVYNDKAPSLFKSGSRLNRAAPWLAPYLVNEETATAYDVGQKVLEDLKIKYIDNLEGGTRLKVLVEMAAKTLSSTAQTPKAQTVVLDKLARDLGKEAFRSQFVTAWNEYLPFDLAKAESIVGDLTRKGDFFNKDGSLKENVNIEQLVKQQIKKYYGTVPVVDYEAEVEEVTPPVSVPGLPEPSPERKEALLKEIRLTYPNFPG